MANELATDYAGNVVEEVTDFGDGTGSRAVYENGVLSYTEEIVLPILPPVEPTPEEQIAILQETVDGLLAMIAGE